MEIRQRITALRREMSAHNLDAYVITTADPHQSEYPPEHWRHRAWISGFHGSAGTVVVTHEKAGLWTDSRYFLEAEHALAGSGIELFRLQEPGVPDYPDWLADVVSADGAVGCDGASLSLSTFRALRDKLASRSINLVAGADLVAAVNPDRAPLPANPITVHDIRFAGMSRGEKLSVVRDAMEKAGATWHAISTLDDIAWILNIRGSDVPYNPVAVAHLLIGPDHVILYCDPAQVEGDVRHALEQDDISVAAYDTFADHLSRITGSVLIAPEQVSVGTERAIAEGVRRVELMNPSTAAKALKNPQQIDHVRNVMIRDGVAMVRFLHWFENTVGTEPVTELSAADRLREFRAEGERFVGEAFRTISAYRGHGALPHYSVDKESDVPIEPAGIYLLDSGAQYVDGTTDITRTVSLDEPSEESRRDATLVLKGHIGIATLQFPVGTTGAAIDAIAREHLWRERKNYKHGTGHGVGFFLNVHEGPQSISMRPIAQDLKPGMIISNEPGLYRPENYGIRIENLIVVSPAETSEFGQFLSFETVTLCPFDRKLIDVSLLTEHEREWVNEYHRLVREKLLGHLDDEVASWLEEACAPL